MIRVARHLTPVHAVALVALAALLAAGVALVPQAPPRLPTVVLRSAPARPAHVRRAEPSPVRLVVSPDGIHTPAHLVGSPADLVVRAAIQNHSDEDNPRNRNERAYVARPAHLLSPGQVGVQATGPRTVTFTQWVRGDSLAPRTFSVTID